MPDRMVRSAPVPSSKVNCSSFFDFGTAMHSFTFTARKSDLLKVSKSTSSLKRGSMTTLEKSMGSEGSAVSAMAASAAQVAAGAPSAGAPSAGAFSVAPTGFPSPNTSSFMWGNSSTSRMDGASVSNMTRRSMPMPTPPAGGMPYSSARM